MAEVKERVKLYLYSLLGLCGLFKGVFTFTFTFPGVSNKAAERKHRPSVTP